MASRRRWLRRGLAGLWLVLIVVIVSACGAPQYTFVASSDSHAFFKVPGGWHKISDSSLLCHPKLVRHFRDVAEAKEIKYQLEILPRGGTDAGGIQRSRGGVPSFTLSVPTRYVHTSIEMCHKEDIEAGIALTAAFIEEGHRHDYQPD